MLLLGAPPGKQKKIPLAFVTRALVGMGGGGAGEGGGRRRGRRDGSLWGWLAPTPGLPPGYSSAEDDAGLSSSDIGANEHLMFMRE